MSKAEGVTIVTLIAMLGGIVGFVVGAMKFAGDFRLGCLAADPGNEVIRVGENYRCVSRERAKELRR